MHALYLFRKNVFNISTPLHPLSIVIHLFSAAFKGGVSEADIHANTKQAQEYEEKVKALSLLLDQQRNQIEAVKDLAANIRQIKLVKPASSPQPVSDAMARALEEAKAASVEFGKDSIEAKLGWETVEEIAQNDFSEVMKNDLSDECLIETIEACEAIEEMQKALHQNEHAGSGRYSG